MSGPPAPAIDLAGRDEGSGPTIVLVHGAGSDHAVWNGLVGPLAERFRVLAPDLRGHGRTPAPESSTYSFEEMEGDLLRFLDAKGTTSAHFVGLSAGALLVLRAGLDRADRVRSVTLVSGAAYTDAHTRSVAARWEETYRQDGPDAFALRLLKDLYYPDWMEAHLDVADRLRREVRKKDFQPAVKWGHEASKFDERKRIASLGPPALIVQAMDDQVVDASHGRILRQSIPRSQIRIFAQTGHMIPIERPRETVEAIRSFVEGVEATAHRGGAA
jgi:pimeloyl-ACP methyl ester carboxylesterase